MIWIKLINQIENIITKTRRRAEEKNLREKNQRYIVHATQHDVWKQETSWGLNALGAWSGISQLVALEDIPDGRLVAGRSGLRENGPSVF